MTQTRSWTMAVSNLQKLWGLQTVIHVGLRLNSSKQFDVKIGKPQGYYLGQIGKRQGYYLGVYRSESIIWCLKSLSVCSYKRRKNHTLSKTSSEAKHDTNAGSVATTLSMIETTTASDMYTAGQESLYASQCRSWRPKKQAREAMRGLQSRVRRNVRIRS